MRPLGDKQCVCGAWYFRAGAWQHEKCVDGFVEPTEVATVTKAEIQCNQCVTKDKEIARLRNQLVEALKNTKVGKPKRDRAAYMRDFRKKERALPAG